MYIVAIAWIYVTLLMALTETSFVAGAATFFFYGLFPLAMPRGLRGTPEAREAVRYLLFKPPLPLPARAPYAALVAAAVGLMPAWTRPHLRLPWLPVAERTVVRGLGSATTGTIRWAMAPGRRARTSQTG